VRRRRLGFWRWIAVILIKPIMLLFTRRTWRGLEHVPTTGPAILVSNHISHADPLVVAHFVYEAGRWPRFLAKSGLFRNPVLGYLLREVEQIPVYRGTADAAKSLEEAIAGLRAGKTVIIYPEGTITRQPDLWPMRGKTGVARLALATGAPVIPIAQWGAQRLYDPIRKKIRIRPRTPVTVVAGPPVDLSAWRDAPPTKATLHEMTDTIMRHIQDLLVEIRGETPPELDVPPAAAGQGER